MVYITRKAQFSAAHRLNNPILDDKENYEIYDKCNNYWGHGHNYTIEVTICGTPNPDTGYLIDLKQLKKIINENIISKVDHKHLNFDVDFLKGKITTLENMSAIFWQQIQDKLPSGKLFKIKMWETENNSVEYFGEEFLIKSFEN
ncbi:MAG: 6-pyruvoyl tetrahydrobiopterin synthase [Ignavibacteria bacterium GWF2_33_9]|nr:MAG: 6-pyruvoyl tetrahydrobiopterin synthase [Ignavibacteria bacterium GWF2_33_9]